MAPTRGQGHGHARLKDIAECAGISKAAVSFALSGSTKVSEKTRRKIRALANKLGYKPNPIVSSVMSQIKNCGEKKFLETIVLINANKSKDAPKKYPIFSKYIDGIRSESAEIGYAVYEIWLHEKSLNAQRLETILDSRGIRGGIIVGHADDTTLPPFFSNIWTKFKFVSAGIRTRNPVFDFISADKFLIAHFATTNIIRSGYKRPALVIDEHIDEVVEGRFIGGFLRAQLALPENARIPPFLEVAKARKNPKAFFDWVSKHKPDAIFSISNTTSEWLEKPEISGKISGFTDIVQLERRSESGEWMAIDQNYELVGRLAVRKLFEILNAPQSSTRAPTATIVQPNWNRKLLVSKPRANRKKVND